MLCEELEYLLSGLICSAILWGGRCAIWHMVKLRFREAKWHAEDTQKKMELDILLSPMLFTCLVEKRQNWISLIGPTVWLGLQIVYGASLDSLIFGLIPVLIFSCVILEIWKIMYLGNNLGVWGYVSWCHSDWQPFGLSISERNFEFSSSWDIQGICFKLLSSRWETCSSVGESSWACSELLAVVQSGLRVLPGLVETIP